MSLVPGAASIIEGKLAEQALLAPLSRETESLGLLASLVYGEASSNSSLRVDMDGPEALGRFTWWADESFYLEALRIEDGADLLSEHGAAAGAPDAIEALRRLALVVARTDALSR